MLITSHSSVGRITLACVVALAGLLGALVQPAPASELPAPATNSAATTNLTAGTNVVAATNSIVETNDVEGDKAWAETSKALRAPTIPAAWRTNTPTPEEEAAFYIPPMREAAAKARDFYTRFPNHPEAQHARVVEYNVLIMAVGKYHDTNQVERLAELRKQRIKDPGTSEADRFDLRLEEVEEAALAKRAEGRDAVFAELEKGAKELRREFPDRQEVNLLLLQVAQNGDNEKSKALAKEILETTSNEDIKKMAQGLYNRLDALGKPLTMQFTAVDGRKVDITKLKGKVVLIDFWATWCGPCVMEMPTVKAVYEKLHKQGFEIIGISLDQDEAALKKFIKEKGLAWPQFFESPGVENRFALEYDVSGIPAMWLVDKHGNLSDLDAVIDLEAKVNKLLAR